MVRMEQSGDSVVMLFGKMIQIPAAAGGGGAHQDPATETQEKDQESSGSGEGSSKPGDETEENAADEQGRPAKARTSNLGPEEKEEEDKSDTREKAPKKPDKILPCPRCKSNDTKFCYFNNYNVNQPRHFCRNCQRYWTAGGSMRNVPIGAGRRKSKTSAATQYRQATMQSAAGGIVPCGVPADQTSGAVLSFGSDAAGLNSRRMGEEKEQSNGSSVTAATNTGGEESETHMFQGCPIRFPWVCQWNSSPHPGCPITLYPASTTAPWGAWGMPAPLHPAQNQSLASEPNSPLGKHSRDGYVLAHGTKPNRHVEENRLLIPRTMRIDDPSDAASSSIWLGIGVENGKGGGGLFKAFGPRGEASTAPTHRNPAALSRSLLFRQIA